VVYLFIYLFWDSFIHLSSAYIFTQLDLKNKLLMVTKMGYSWFNCTSCCIAHSLFFYLLSATWMDRSVIQEDMRICLHDLRDEKSRSIWHLHRFEIAWPSKPKQRLFWTVTNTRAWCCDYANIWWERCAKWKDGQWESLA
jgi:hypothetical protein